MARRSVGRTVGWSVLAALVGVLAVAGVRTLSSDDGVTRPETGEGQVRVGGLYEAPGGTETVVVGYVFHDEVSGTRLCEGRKGSSPAVCVPPFVDVDGLDLRRVPLIEGDDGSFWTTEPVVVAGTRQGGRFDAAELLTN